MELDRWVIPPAVAAAVFALAAVSPPVTVHDLRRGLRLEAATATDGVILLRAALEDRVDGTLSAPRALRVEHAGATFVARAADGVSSVSLAVPTDLRPGDRALLAVSADELRATLRLPISTAPAVAAPPRGSSLGAVVAEGNLLPDVPGTVLVRAPDAVEVAIEPLLDGARVSPPRAPVGPCGVGRFDVTIEGMGAPVTLVARRADGVTARAHVRLPLQPGGVSLRRDGLSVTVRGAFAGQLVYLLAGSPRGARWWSAARLAADPVAPRAALAVPRDAVWVRASTDPLFRDDAAPALRWDLTPSPNCARDDAARPWAEVTAPAPPSPPVGLAFDGAARARAALVARSSRARSFAWLGLAGSLVAEVTLILGLGLRQGMSNSMVVRSLRRDDLGRLAAGVVALLLLGFALALAASRATLTP